MYTIEYSPRGKAVNDWDMEFITPNINQILEMNLLDTDRRMTLHVSTENVLYAVRCAIAEGELDHSKIQFKLNDNIHALQIDGTCQDIPVPYPGVINHLAERIILASWK